MRKLKSGGGWQALRYSLKYSKEVGGLRMWKAMTSHNACKTCALGMGGQLGGMTNEARRFPEVCKKSFQAMASDMRGKIEPRFWETYSISQLQELSPRELEMSGRITDPVIAEPGDTHYRTISWEEAYERIATALKKTAPERMFLYCSGRSSNEAGFLLNLFARDFGTNHISNCSFYCHQASGVGLGDSLGTGTATVSLEDVEHCDTLFLIGGNPASNHPRLMTLLMKLRHRGGKVIVINPAKELGLVNFRVPSNVGSMLFGTDIASTYVQPSIGGDIAVMVGIAKVLVEKGQIDQAYLEKATDGFTELQSYVTQVSWKEIEAASGVSQSEIEEVAAIYAASERTIFAWAMGITHHVHGVQNVQWIVNLGLLRGMIGKAGAGVMPIRGHSNVQGMGSMGVSPKLKAAALDRLESIGVKPPAFEGYDTLAAMEASHRGEMDFSLCLGGNLYGANPDSTFSGEALAKLGTVVYMNTTLNTGHAHGLGKTTIILPVLARDEEKQSTTQESMFNYVRLSDGGIVRHEGLKPESEILAEVARRVTPEGGPLDWEKLKDHEEIRGLISRLVPGFEQLESIGKTKREFEIPGRVLHTPIFNTPTRRAAIRAYPIPALTPLGENELRLMTVRSEGQFNTVVYEEQDLYRNQERRDVILMNGSDIARMGLKVDQLVDVSNENGTMYGILVREFDISRGAAMMYYPESNVLVSREVDPRSKTPAFKAVTVKVMPSKRRDLITLEGAKPAARGGLNAC